MRSRQDAAGKHKQAGLCLPVFFLPYDHPPGKPALLREAHPFQGWAASPWL